MWFNSSRKPAKAVIQSHADLGIAFDGDADRVVMVDKAGNLIDGDHILYILATQTSQKPAGIAGTLMSNLSLELALKSRCRFCSGQSR